ncbi:MAG: Rnase Y domain-containing protein, partial [Desulfobacterales bacterium]|nr:Rnase Y domain-containing protein [Desulfobacterales bacterium]
MSFSMMLAFMLVLLAVGAAILYVIKMKIDQQRLDFQEEQRVAMEQAAKKAETLLREAKLEARSRLLEMKSTFDAETEETRTELKREERRLSKKSEKLDKIEDQCVKKEKYIEKNERIVAEKLESVVQKEESYAQLLTETKKELEKVSGMTLEQAKELLLKTMEDEARHEGAKMVKKITTEVREKADKEAKKILSTAIQRYAGDYVAERTVSVVNLPGDEMKGRIIGREGRNIRALEAATGIDLIIDDTPEAVILSGFNPVRREVARLSLEKLIS